ncbi:Kinesin motor domain [Trypanosoma vivax]|nr:Kinesin motor domain [Trypanosoma vivax]
MDCSTSTESVIHHSELEGKSLSALSRAICQGGERNGCSESLGLLPRLVLVLLERRGKPVKLVREDDATIRYTASKRGSDHVGGVKCGNSCGCEKEKNIDRRSGDAQWTLQELTFYGVELYLDEFCDLLDPSKRRVTNMGDIGGLDAFCQKLNDAVPQSGRAGGGASAASKGDAGYRGGGIPITSVDDFRRCYALASRNRVTKGHQRNDTSSRSHAVFILQLRFEYSDVSPTLAGAGSKGSSSSFYSYVAMVDLAGSERVKQTKVEGAQLREAQYINKSLSALSAVLLALHQRSGHVPYRDSKLTRLLRPCLERGSVLTLVHVSPCAAEEALNCLKFAEQVQHTAIQSHSLYNAAEELVAVFEDLNDPDVEERLLQYRRSEEEYKLLCAEVRLAYFYRTMGEGPQLPLFNTPTETADAEPFSSANYLIPFPHDVAHYKARERIISRCTKRYFFSYYREEEDRLRAAAGEIKREQEEIVSTVARRTSQDIENMKLVVERLRCSNAQLAEENSQPVLRDAHAMEIKQRLKELATEVTNYAREKLLLLEGTRAIRQRLAIQNELEQCLDEQLRMLRGDAGCGTRGLLLGDDSIDKDMESIYECQLLLAEEMSQLRKESTCFVRCDEIWEGLWARMMRQELLLAVALELEMMEDIVLGPSSLRWVLESIGATAEAVGDVESPTENADGRAGRVTKLQTINASQLMSALDKSLQQSAKDWSLLSSNCGGGETTMRLQCLVVAALCVPTTVKPSHFLSPFLCCFQMAKK